MKTEKPLHSLVGIVKYLEEEETFSARRLLEAWNSLAGGWSGRWRSSDVQKSGAQGGWPFEIQKKP